MGITEFGAGLVGIGSFFPLLHNVLLATTKSSEARGRKELSRLVIPSSPRPMPKGVQVPNAKDVDQTVPPAPGQSARYVGPAVAGVQRAWTSTLRFIGFAVDQIHFGIGLIRLGHLEHCSPINRHEFETSSRVETVLASDDRGEQSNPPADFDESQRTKPSRAVKETNYDESMSLDPSASLPKSQVTIGGQNTPSGIFGLLSPILGLGLHLARIAETYSNLPRAQYFSSLGMRVRPNVLPQVPIGASSWGTNPKSLDNLTSSYSKIESSETRLGLKHTGQTTIRVPPRIDLSRIQSSPAAGHPGISPNRDHREVPPAMLPSLGTHELLETRSTTIRRGEQLSMAQLPEVSTDDRPLFGIPAEPDTQDTNDLRLKISRILAEEARRYLAGE